jgi:hypothetical protein
MLNMVARDGPDHDLARAGLQQHACDLADGGAGGHHVIDDGDAAPAQLGPAPRLDRERGAHVASALLGRKGELVRRVLHAQQQARIGLAVQRTTDAACELPGLVVAALAQAFGAQRYRQQQCRRGAVVALERGEQALRQRGREIERAVELVVRDQAVPRGVVVDRGERARERRRVGQARAAQARAVGQLQRAALATRVRRREALDAGGAHALRAPAPAHGAQAGQSLGRGEEAGEEKHGSIYWGRPCPTNPIRARAGSMPSR